MSTRFLAAATTAAFGMFTSVFAGHANACSYSDLRQTLTAGSPAAKNAARFAASINAAGLAVDAGAVPAPQSVGGQRNAPIVGLWKFAFTAPDGKTSIDWGFQQWHDDGTELTNSGGHPAEDGNFCMGVWKQHGGSYQLNHWAIAWGLPPDFDPTVLGGLINIRELVDVDQSGAQMSGTVSEDLYAEDGTTFIAHLGDGTVAGARVRP